MLFFIEGNVGMLKSRDESMVFAVLVVQGAPIVFVKIAPDYAFTCGEE